MKVRATQKNYIDVELSDREVKGIVERVLEDVYGFGSDCYVEDGHIWWGNLDDREVPVRVASATEENRRAVEMFSKIHKYWQNKKVY